MEQETVDHHRRQSPTEGVGLYHLQPSLGGVSLPLCCVASQSLVRVRVTGHCLRLPRFGQVDWMCWWPIARRKGMVGDLKVILKQVLSLATLYTLARHQISSAHIHPQEIAYLPGLGNGMDDLEFLFLARDWEKDKHTVAHR